MIATIASTAYFKRYRMEVDLDDLPRPELPAGFRPLAWSPGLLEAHAEVLYGAFCREIDASVFASLGDRDGCCTLMSEIARQHSFVPEATWLVCGPGGPCASVQGLRERGARGAIQNVGVLPVWRGRGLGQAVVLLSLQGFRAAGLARCQLEVTAQNDAAVRLYRRLGFRRSKILYKAVPAFPELSMSSH
jgi:ribosomal protein S18 acetylase RimI-like enzyme